MDRMIRKERDAWDETNEKMKVVVESNPSCGGQCAVAADRSIEHEKLYYGKLPAVIERK